MCTRTPQKPLKNLLDPKYKTFNRFEGALDGVFIPASVPVWNYS
ncbi:hypothetical protein VP01_390g8 [Puccinia sorghi]|uniref:Uncharacterized protein n=1 Tax=Puccinia sorghi TaxID=27349 RepID=A0A0L6USM9_9BASI|nr:hypothetical protein VP01_390g8 [Puccinia sorghi]